MDLPALNLSESDSSDSDSENANHAAGEIVTEEYDQGHEINGEEDNSSRNDDIEKEEQKDTEPSIINDEVNNQDELDSLAKHSDDLEGSNSVIQNIWDNFKNYQASKEKMDNMFIEPENTEKEQSEETGDELSSEVFSLEIVLRDHDYCLAPEQTTDSTIIEVSFYD